jgi:hypothetical protein
MHELTCSKNEIGGDYFLDSAIQLSKYKITFVV